MINNFDYNRSLHNNVITHQYHIPKFLGDILLPICFMFIPISYIYLFIMSFTNEIYLIPLFTWNSLWIFRNNIPFIFLRDYIRNGALKDDKMVIVNNHNNILNNNKIMYVLFPHGMYPYSMSIFAIKNNSIPLASRILFNLPGIYEYALHAGASSVDKDNLEKIMKTGTNIVISPGSFEESCYSGIFPQLFCLKNKYGYIKYAIKYNYKIIPVYQHGVNEQYSCPFTFLLPLRLFLAKLKLMLPIFYGKYIFLPRDHIIYEYLGKEILTNDYDFSVNDHIYVIHDHVLNSVNDLMTSINVEYKFI